MKITILGSGTSIGVPMPTCQCEVCKSTDPRDNRFRCSALVEAEDGKQILIDCGPDFRLQSIRANIMSLDALLLTHNHFDHCYGIDDLRPWAYYRELPTYADEKMSNALMSRWDYIFVHKYPGVPKLALHTLYPENGEEFTVGETTIVPIRCYHGNLPILAFRIGNLGYVTDCTAIKPNELLKLQGIDTLIIDALRWIGHATHYSVAQAMEIVDYLKPRQTYFTHMSHDMGLHKDFEQRLRTELGDVYSEELLSTVHLAFDQLTIDCK